MVVARELSSVKKHILNNESGNLVIILAILAMIGGAIGYWVSLTDKVDKEVRGLGASQVSVFLRADFRNTIKKAIQGRLQPASCPLMASISESFYDFTKSNPVIEKTYTDNTATPNNNEAVSNTEIKCFFNPSRYSNLDWERVHVSLRRVTEPNYMTLSSFISADVSVNFKVAGKPTIQKYQFKYRLDVLTMDHYGIVFTTSTQNDPMIQLQDANSSVKVKSSVLFDLPNRINSNISLSNLMSLPESDRLIYTKEVETPAASFNSNSALLTFLQGHSLFEVFKMGIQYNSLMKDAGFKLPYEINSSEWKEFIDLTPLATDGYPLPGTSPVSAIYNPYTNVITHTYGGDKNSTVMTYNAMYGSGSEKEVVKSCAKVLDFSSGLNNIYLFNHLDQDFTIDLSKNKVTDYPPLFCGLVIAKNLYVILNDEDASSDFHQHHLLGKFILSGRIIVQKGGQLNIHDISDFTEDQIEYSSPAIEIQNLRTQFFNQKYYSTQNFFLPVFKPGKYPPVSGGDLLSNTDRYYVPRGTKAFFTENCSGKKCRTPNIESPTAEDLASRHWRDLVFEVYDVE